MSGSISTLADEVDDAPDEGHEISACYDNLRVTRAGGNSPTLDCSCGRSFAADTWEEAGADMDGHLADVRDG